MQKLKGVSYRSDLSKFHFVGLLIAGIVSIYRYLLEYDFNQNECEKTPGSKLKVNLNFLFHTIHLISTYYGKQSIQ